MEVAGLFIGGGIGIVFTALYEGVKQLAGRPTKFKAELQALESTLASLDLEVIQQIGRHNEAMGLPNEVVRDLEQELNKGVRIIGELSDASLWKRIDSQYMSQLAELNRSLSILERKLRLQSMLDGKKTQHMMQILITLTLNQEPGRDIGYGTGSLLSTARLLDIAPQQEALYHTPALDQLRNMASTSTDLRQFHGSGEIQEVGSSSDHLPYPQENSNFRGSDNQLQIDDGQLVTTSYRVMLKIIVKVSITSDRSKTKAMKLAVGVDGVDRVMIDMKNGQLEVVGEGVDTVYLLMLLRKHMHHAEAVRVEPVKVEDIRLIPFHEQPNTSRSASASTVFHEQPNTSRSASASFLVKVCKFFKPTKP